MQCVVLRSTLDVARCTRATCEFVANSTVARGGAVYGRDACLSQKQITTDGVTPGRARAARGDALAAAEVWTWKDGAPTELPGAFDAALARVRRTRRLSLVESPSEPQTRTLATLLKVRVVLR